MKYRKRITAAVLAGLMLCTNMGGASEVYGAPAGVDVDETMYVNLDYYGKTSKVNVVKSLSPNGNTEFTDYGTYQKVVNMSNSAEPQIGDGAVTWTFPADQTGRFYYQCTMDNDQTVLPWDFDVSYKLNGVPTNADRLAGASGVIEINVKATPNDGAKEYYRNNMVLMVAFPVDMTKCYSVDAEGAQTQNLGETTAVVFTALPGEEGDYTVRIGTDSFESIGVIMAMAPGTVEDLEHIKDLKEAKDTWKDAGDTLYDSLEQMAKSVESMRDGVNQVQSGLQSAESARETWSGSKDQILAGNDQTLAALSAMSSQMETMVPHLQTAKDAAETVHEGMDNIVDTLGQMQDPLRKLHTRLKHVENDMESLSTELPEIQKLMLQVIALDAQFQANEQLTLAGMGEMQQALLEVDDEYYDVPAERPSGSGSGGQGGSGSQGSQADGSDKDSASGQSGSGSQAGGNSQSGANSQDGSGSQAGGSSQSGAGGQSGAAGQSGVAGQSGAADQSGAAGQSGTPSKDTSGAQSGDGSQSSANDQGNTADQNSSSDQNTTPSEDANTSQSGSGSQDNSGAQSGPDIQTSVPADDSASTPAGNSTEDTPASTPEDTSENTSGNTSEDTSENTPENTPGNTTANTPDTSTPGTPEASITPHNVPLVAAPIQPDYPMDAGTAAQLLYGKMQLLEQLSKQSSELVATMSDMTGNTADAAKYSRELIDNLDFLIEDVTALNDSLDTYYPDLQEALTDAQELVNRTTEALNSGISTMTILQNTLKNSSDDFDAAARESLRGSMELLDKSLSVLDSTTAMREAGRTMKDTIDNELDKFDTDNRFLFMDPDAEKVSLTSEKNKAPKTLQIVLRTDEISLDSDDNKPTDIETEKEHEGPLRRMWNVLVKMWQAIVAIFKDR